MKSPLKLYFKVYLLLILLLAATVLCSLFAVGGALIGLLIASAKAFLVLSFYMKLKEKKPSLRLLALASLLWILFLFGLIGADYLSRPLIQPKTAERTSL